MSRENADLRELLLTPCRTLEALHAWVRLFCGIDVVRRATCDECDPPFAYLDAAYFEPAEDLVVWAPRGGGKTRLAAIATLLDLLHKPGVQVRVLGGSLEQSLRLWEHLLPDVRRLLPRGLVGTIGDRAHRLALRGGGGAGVLPQSQRAVRGLRVHKLRCDEVELFDPAVWEAAQLVTRSGRGIGATVEALSTLHVPGGLMAGLVDAPGRRVLRWCLMDVLERCPPTRHCDGCGLWDDCRGRAKTRDGGFFGIRDALRMKARVGTEVWQTEMTCRRPATRGRVFPSFEPRTHVRPFAGEGRDVCCGIDFGFANPFVCLWAVRAGETWHVVDEHVQAGLTLGQHLAEMASRPWPPPRVVGCDPAGRARAGHTGQSDVDVLRHAGYRVSTRASRIEAGLRRIRELLSPAAGPPRLFVDPRCRLLIKAMSAYRYVPGTETPDKDGLHDHPVDALRYLLLCADTRAGLREGRY